MLNNPEITIDINETAEYYLKALAEGEKSSLHYAETEIRPRLNCRGWDVVPIEGTDDHSLVYIGSKIA